MDVVNLVFFYLNLLSLNTLPKIFIFIEKMLKYLHKMKKGRMINDLKF